MELDHSKSNVALKKTSWVALLLACTALGFDLYTIVGKRISLKWTRLKKLNITLIYCRIHLRLSLYQFSNDDDGDGDDWKGSFTQLQRWFLRHHRLVTPWHFFLNNFCSSRVTVSWWWWLTWYLYAIQTLQRWFLRNHRLVTPWHFL